MKIKLRSHIQVVEYDNDEVIKGDNVFQMDELVDPYQITLYTKLKKIKIYVSLRILMLILMLMS
jgi:hypothetical protein